MLTPLETRVLNVVAMFEAKLPPEQLADMSELARAGEPGVALENLATQLFEYDIAVEDEARREIEALGQTMKLDANYWNRLRRA
jgi:hypothetical protein